MEWHPARVPKPDRRIPRAVAATGWVSLVLGAFLTIAPRIGAAVMGLGDRAGLARSVGAGDLAIGAGLLLDGDRARWMGARVAGNAVIAGLCGWALTRGTPNRGRAAGLLAAMLGLIPMDLRVARRLRSGVDSASPPVG